MVRGQFSQFLQLCLELVDRLGQFSYSLRGLPLHEPRGAWKRNWAFGHSGKAAKVTPADDQAAPQ
jgi:hypothetical protein